MPLQIPKPRNVLINSPTAAAAAAAVNNGKAKYAVLLVSLESHSHSHSLAFVSTSETFVSRFCITAAGEWPFGHCRSKRRHYLMESE